MSHREIGPESIPEGPRIESNIPQPTPVEVEAMIARYSRKFKDRLYVPTPEEFEEMEKFAGDHIAVILPEDEERPMEYLTANTAEGEDNKRLNPTLARSLLDHIREARWRLPDRDRGLADLIHALPPADFVDLYKRGDPQVLDKPQDSRYNLINFYNFLTLFGGKRMWPQNLISEVMNFRGNPYVLGIYKQYVGKRLILSEALEEREREEERVLREKGGQLIPLRIPEYVQLMSELALRDFREGLRNK